MVSNASDDLPEPDRPVITISWSRGRSRSMFLRLWVRAPRMRMVSIAIGGGDLGSGGGGRRWNRDRTRERSEPPIWGQMVEIASLPGPRRSRRDARRSGRWSSNCRSGFSREFFADDRKQNEGHAGEQRRPAAGRPGTALPSVRASCPDSGARHPWRACRSPPPPIRSVAALAFLSPSQDRNPRRYPSGWAGRVSRQAGHGWPARESGQDALLSEERGPARPAAGRRWPRTKE